ncbi:hypothetical protein [Oceanirhabdus sp. W0125-5]|uniref:hypothetical protein n=1 Tax=Oceanirhabdus sp. W0125-5 TaxID=2999116 RepID=UPI0022F31391|nr:hypothetical protein [Oceanirhabdus sp. W0125-5]WBW99022.1 hypothetical protein OW730_09830 [Oceanirhabdus sp. W0125-5]
MMKKGMVLFLASIAVVFQLTGCGKGKVEKIVLQKDVQETSNLLEISGVEKIDLKLNDKEVFYPGFYFNGELYGYIGFGLGNLDNKEPKEGYLKDGYTRDKLFKIDQENKLKETSKVMLNNRYTYNKSYDFNDGLVREIDYTKEDVPRESEDISNTLKKYNIDKIDYILPALIDDKEYIYLFNFSNSKINQYLLDVMEDKLYEFKINDRLIDLIYVEALKSFIWVDKDFTCYKLVFNENYIELEEYIDLKEYMSYRKNDDLKNVSIGALNENEILIIEMGYLRDDGYFSYHPLYETLSISKFNFKTNQFKELLKSSGDRHISSISMSKDILVFDEFEKESGYISPKTRYFKTIDGDELKTIYKESIEDEGKTLSPFIRTLISEDKKEIFLLKQVTDMADGVETTMDVIYKKYTFK